MSRIVALSYSKLRELCRYQWDNTWIDQTTGEYLISELRKKYRVPVQVFTHQKMIKDGKLIERVKQMDTVEMTEYLRKLIQEHRVRFPKDASRKARDLTDQLSYFSKHTTDAGSVDYYAPGGEQDDMVKALMTACFAVRNEIEGGDAIPVIEPVFNAEVSLEEELDLMLAIDVEKNRI